MQEKHRSVIYKAMPLIIADLIVDYTFLAKFLQDGIFIEESIEAILSAPTYDAKAHLFCQYLDRADDDAYGVLLDALGHTSQDHIAEELKAIERDMGDNISKQNPITFLDESHRGKEKQSNILERIHEKLTIDYLFMSYFVSAGLVEIDDVQGILEGSFRKRVYAFFGTVDTADSLFRQVLLTALVNTKQDHIATTIREQPENEEYCEYWKNNIAWLKAIFVCLFAACIAISLSFLLFSACIATLVALDNMWIRSEICWGIDNLDLFFISNGGHTALMVASSKGCKEEAALLIKNGANVEDKNNDGYQALHLAARNGHAALVQLLLDNQAPVDGSTAHGRTPLILRGSSFDADLIKLLAQHGASVYTNSEGWVAIEDVEVDEATRNYWTPLMIAVSDGYLEIAKILIKYKADVNLSNSNGLTALHMAVLKNSTQMVQLLLESHADVDKTLRDVNNMNYFGLTALHIAVLKNSTQIVELLLDTNAEIDKTTQDVNISNYLCLTALHMAVLKNSTQIVQLLLESHAEVDKTEGDGFNPLELAVYRSCLDIVKILIKYKADVNHLNKNGLTALYVAIVVRHTQVVQFLLDNHADVDKIQQGGTTPLMVAVYLGRLDIVKSLIKEKASINHRSITGYTALHLAATRGYDSIIELLLENGADVTIRCYSGFTALDYAISYNHISSIMLLESKHFNRHIFNEPVTTRIIILFK